MHFGEKNTNKISSVVFFYGFLGTIINLLIFILILKNLGWFMWFSEDLNNEYYQFSDSQILNFSAAMSCFDGIVLQKIDIIRNNEFLKTTILFSSLLNELITISIFSLSNELSFDDHGII